MGGLMPKYKEPEMPEAPEAPPPPPPPPQKENADIQEEKRSALERKKYEVGRRKTLLDQVKSGDNRKKTLLGQ